MGVRSYQTVGDFIRVLFGSAWICSVLDLLFVGSALDLLWICSVLDLLCVGSALGSPSTYAYLAPGADVVLGLRDTTNGFHAGNRS
jgi:hypothetical protein